MDQLGIFGLIHLAIVVYALMKILDSGETTAGKILWVLIVAALPLIGLIVWYLLGPGSPRRQTQ